MINLAKCSDAMTKLSNIQINTPTSQTVTLRAQIHVPQCEITYCGWRFMWTYKPFKMTAYGVLFGMLGYCANVCFDMFVGQLCGLTWAIHLISSLSESTIRIIFRASQHYRNVLKWSFRNRVPFQKSIPSIVSDFQLSILLCGPEIEIDY